jgi:hypothetical protein
MELVIAMTGQRKLLDRWIEFVARRFERGFCG